MTYFTFHKENQWIKRIDRSNDFTTNRTGRITDGDAYLCITVIYRPSSASNVTRTNFEITAAIVADIDSNFVSGNFHFSTKAKP